MLKIVKVCAPKGGSLVYQADLQKKLTRNMESQLNDLKPTKVHSISQQDTEYEFGLVATVEIDPQPLSTKKSKEKQK